MSKINQDIEHIAGLARIALSEEEKKKLGMELSAILGFVEKLGEANTDGVLPLAGGTDLESEMRKDEQIDSDLERKQKEIMEQVPEKKLDWVKVKAVYGSK